MGIFFRDGKTSPLILRVMQSRLAEKFVLIATQHTLAQARMGNTILGAAPLTLRLPLHRRADNTTSTQAILFLIRSAHCSPAAPSSIPPRSLPPIPREALILAQPQSRAMREPSTFKTHGSS